MVHLQENIKNDNLFNNIYIYQRTMDEYLLQGGFTKKKINNYQYGYYLELQQNNNHILYAKFNSVKHLLNYHYGIKNRVVPDELFIIKYNDLIKIKIVDNVNKHSKLKNIPYMKRLYEHMFKIIPNAVTEYSIIIDKKMNINKNQIEILQSFNIDLLNSHDELDNWLDR